MSARPVGTWFLVAAGVAVIGALVAALAVIGSPARQRAQRFDERRVRELMQLQAAIDRYASNETRLPASLAALARSASADGLTLVDPETGARYGYAVLDARRYRLCATFATARRKGDADTFDDAWLHPAGRHCFVRARPASGSLEEAAAEAAAAAAAVTGGDSVARPGAD